MSKKFLIEMFFPLEFEERDVIINQRRLRVKNFLIYMLHPSGLQEANVVVVVGQVLSWKRFQVQLSANAKFAHGYMRTIYGLHAHNIPTCLIHLIYNYYIPQPFNTFIILLSLKSIHSKIVTSHGQRATLKMLR